ncbi:hypothetical protein Fot_19393 [Forsythia ovata]|uniref:Uncharacterized protein n=1 Tax=Forsythia ovata TaxID=205694 RepID=A0ABD1VKX2_9LAMI
MAQISPQDSCAIGMHPKANLASIGGSHTSRTLIVAPCIFDESIPTSGGWQITSNLAESKHHAPHGYVSLAYPTDQMDETGSTGQMDCGLTMGSLVSASIPSSFGSGIDEVHGRECNSAVKDVCA